MARSTPTRRPPPRKPSSSQAHRPPAKSGFPVWPVAIGLVLLLGIVVIAIAALGGDDADTSDAGAGDSSGAPIEETAPAAEVSGDGLPQFQSTENDTAIGLPFPILSGADLDGGTMTIGDSGRPTLVVLLAHWCPHCQREVPVVQQWVDEGNLPDDVDLVAVSTSIDPSRPNYPPRAWLADEGWTAPTLIDPEGDAAMAAGLSGYPYFVALDADGNVVARNTGELSTEQLDQLVQLTRA